MKCLEKTMAKIRFFILKIRYSSLLSHLKKNIPICCLNFNVEPGQSIAFISLILLLLVQIFSLLMTRSSLTCWCGTCWLCCGGRLFDSSVILGLNFLNHQKVFLSISENNGFFIAVILYLKSLHGCCKIGVSCTTIEKVRCIPKDRSTQLRLFDQRNFPFWLTFITSVTCSNAIAASEWWFVRAGSSGVGRIRSYTLKWTHFSFWIKSNELWLKDSLCNTWASFSGQIS